MPSFRYRWTNSVFRLCHPASHPEPTAVEDALAVLGRRLRALRTPRGGRQVRLVRSGIFGVPTAPTGLQFDAFVTELRRTAGWATDGAPGTPWSPAWAPEPAPAGPTGQHRRPAPRQLQPTSTASCPTAPPSSCAGCATSAPPPTTGASRSTAPATPTTPTPSSPPAHPSERARTPSTPPRPLPRRPHRLDRPPTPDELAKRTTKLRRPRRSAQSPYLAEAPGSVTVGAGAGAACVRGPAAGEHRARPRPS